MLLSDFFPPNMSGSPNSSRASSDTGMESLASRLLITGPSGCGISSMLMQHAFNRARCGFATLYVHCGPREHLYRNPPIHPTTIDDLSGTAPYELDAQLLKLIYIKYAESWAQLREILVNLHLSESVPPFASVQPSGLFIDGLDSLIGAPTGNDAHQTPSKFPLHQGSAGSMPLAVALAAHTTDFLGAPTCVAETKDGSTVSSDSAILLIACSSPGPDIGFISRWLPGQLNISAETEAHTFALRACRCKTHVDVLVRYSFDTHVLRLLESVQPLTPVAGLRSQKMLGSLQPQSAAHPPGDGTLTPRL